MSSGSPPGFAALPAAVQSALHTEMLGGMVNPVGVTLKRGVRLFRMADVARARGFVRKGLGKVLAAEMSPWWIAECDYLRIVRDAERRAGPGRGGRRSGAPPPFSEAFRDACAVPYAWPGRGGRPPTPAPLDAILSGDVLHELGAFMGRGAAQQEVLGGGLTRTWPGWQDITQLYVFQLSKHAPEEQRRAALRKFAMGAPNFVLAHPTLYRDGS